MQVELAKISLDTSTQSRAAINQEAIDEYVEAMRKTTFPPVVLFRDKGGQLYIADGWHRVLAAIKAGAIVIEADIEQGSLKDAIFYSVGSNINHGMRRTADDKRKAITMLMRGWPKMSNRQIAEKAGVSHGLVNTVRKELSAHYGQIESEREVTRGNQTYTVETANIGKSPPRPASEPEEFEPPSKPKKKKRGKSLFKDVQRIVSKAHLEITGKKLDWNKDAARITYHVDKITDLAIDSARHFVLLILQDYLAELGVQVDKGKIPGKFVPGELEKYWLNLERYLSAQNMQRVVDNATADLREKQPQKNLFEKK